MNQRKIDFRPTTRMVFGSTEGLMSGERIVIAKAGKPIAVLSPIDEVPNPRIPGMDSGKLVISPDFDAPLPEFDL